MELNQWQKFARHLRSIWCLFLYWFATFSLFSSTRFYWFGEALIRHWKILFCFNWPNLAMKRCFKVKCGQNNKVINCRYWIFVFMFYTRDFIKRLYCEVLGIPLARAHRLVLSGILAKWSHFTLKYFKANALYLERFDF